eukprot:5641791-Pyramimonas_sp.AAC.1
MTQLEETQRVTVPRRESTTFVVYHKNVRGLVSAGRLQELVCELDHARWDVVTFDETWRSEKQELYTVFGGHILAGSGHANPDRGLANLIHRKWAESMKKVAVISERLMYVDLLLGGQWVRIVPASWPNAKYAGIRVQEMCTALSEIKRDAKQNQYTFVLAGGFNAEVGCRLESDNPKSVGLYRLRCENSRGQWLKQLAFVEQLLICNTFFP